jgi:hypothetical protein
MDNGIDDPEIAPVLPAHIGARMYRHGVSDKGIGS